MIKIYTFGNFDIRKDNESILDKTSYHYRLAKLFKYMLTFKNKKLVPERIIEDLWYGEDFIDPKKVLRTQISRLRKGIGQVDDYETFFEIAFSYGYYIFNLYNNKVILDVDIFEKVIEKGNSLKETHPEEAIELYKEAIFIYKGEYLGEIDYEEWLIPIRNRYERLYLKTLFRLIDLLNESKNYIEIIEICEDAFNIISLNENLNICFIEALINIGEKKYALNHYNYVTSKLYRQMNELPSQEMQRLYRRLTKKEEVWDNIEISNIDQKLEDKLEKKRALLCDSDYFIFLYNLEKRRNERSDEKKEFVGVITIKTLKDSKLPKDLLLNIMKELEEIISSLLRKGDVFSIWNENQIVFILSSIEYKNISSVKDRILKKFSLINKQPTIYLEISIKPI